MQVSRFIASSRGITQWVLSPAVQRRCAPIQRPGRVEWPPHWPPRAMRIIVAQELFLIVARIAGGKVVPKIIYRARIFHSTDDLEIESIQTSSAFLLHSRLSTQPELLGYLSSLAIRSLPQPVHLLTLRSLRCSPKYRCNPFVNCAVHSNRQSQWSTPRDRHWPRSSTCTANPPLECI